MTAEVAGRRVDSHAPGQPARAASPFLAWAALGIGAAALALDLGSMLLVYGMRSYPDENREIVRALNVLLWLLLPLCAVGIALGLLTCRRGVPRRLTALGLLGALLAALHVGVPVGGVLDAIAALDLTRVEHAEPPRERYRSGGAAGQRSEPGMP